VLSLQVNKTRGQIHQMLGISFCIVLRHLTSRSLEHAADVTERTRNDYHRTITLTNRVFRELLDICFRACLSSLPLIIFMCALMLSLITSTSPQTGQLTGNFGHMRTWCLANCETTTWMLQCSHVSRRSGHSIKCLSKSRRITSDLHLFGHSIFSYWHWAVWDWKQQGFNKDINGTNKSAES